MQLVEETRKLYVQQEVQDSHSLLEQYSHVGECGW